MTKIYGLVGNPLKQSMSPYVHSLFGDYDYSLMPMDETELDGFLKKKEFAGINVTIPYKKTVIRYCDILTPRAAAIGSVNTVTNDNGILVGDNTDYAGFLYAADKAGISFGGRKVLILGSGGTQATASGAASDMGASEITVVSRSGAVNYENVYDRFSDAEIIINTTPVGMYPKVGEKPITLSRFPKLCGVIDVVYNPLQTELSAEAEALGIKHTGGLAMLVAQAGYACNRFTGIEVSKSTIASAVRKTLLHCTNLVLIGMPGCGKSRIGDICAKQSGRRFIDTDNEIEKKAGMSVAEIFKTHGEAYFRDLESEEVSLAGAERGCVIAVGGGAVLRKENVKALKRNGMLVMLKRDIAKLATNGRPLSNDIEAVNRLYLQRRSIYEGCADASVENNSKAECAAKKVWEEFNEAIGD